MNEKFSLIGSGRIWGSFKNFVDREIRERRRGERRLYEQRATKHQLLARNSCVADARSYRIARQFPVKSFAVINQSDRSPQIGCQIHSVTWYCDWRVR